MENLSRNSNRNCFERISPTSKSKQMQRRSLRSLVEAGFSARWNAHVGSPQKNPIQTDQSEICQFVLLASMKAELCFTDLPFSNNIIEKKGKKILQSKFHSHIHNTDSTHFTIQLIQNSAGNNLVPEGWRFSFFFKPVSANSEYWYTRFPDFSSNPPDHSVKSTLHLTLQPDCLTWQWHLHHTITGRFSSGFRYLQHRNCVYFALLTDRPAWRPLNHNHSGMREAPGAQMTLKWSADSARPFWESQQNNKSQWKFVLYTSGSCLVFLLPSYHSCQTLA